MRVTYPELLGTTAPMANAADLRTSGWELSLTWHDKIGQDWRYGINLALSDNISEITKYDNPTGSLSEHYVGKRMGEIWVMLPKVFSGRQRSGCPCRPSNLGANWRAGDIKYKDLNGDKKINPEKYTCRSGRSANYRLQPSALCIGINPDVSYKTGRLIFSSRDCSATTCLKTELESFLSLQCSHMEKYFITNRGARTTAMPILPRQPLVPIPKRTFIAIALCAKWRLHQAENLTINYNLPQSVNRKTWT